MTARKMNPLLALLPLVALVGAAAMSIFVWKAGMYVPLATGIVVAAIVGVAAGFKWSEIQEYMSTGVARALPAVFILFLIGLVIGTWIASGVIPTLIYYGLAIINPKIFVPAVALATGIISITLGSSFTSIATVGLAFMAIGSGLGFPAGLVAGAVISGAYLGDKLSPLSDTTNIAPAMADTDLFSHVRHMMWDTIPAFVIALLVYWILGARHSAQAAGAEEVRTIMEGLDATFAISPWLLLVPIITIVLVAMRFPAIPALLIVGILGALVAMIFQGTDLTGIVRVMTGGFKSETGIGALDRLLSRGGMTSMLGTIGLLTVATALGGVFEGTGMFKAIVDPIIERTKRVGNLILTTVIATFIVGFASGAQVLAIILPARAFVRAYKIRGLDTKNLSRVVEAAGTVGINLVPWGVPAIFAAGVLGVEPAQFIPFAVFVYLVPLINVAYGYAGVTIAKREYSQDEIEATA